MASAISALLSNSGAAAGSATTQAPQPPSEQMFLQLLVAQIQNQDPLNPTDSTQFVSQLAQFSELEQVIGIRQDLETAMAPGSGTAGAGNSNAGGTTGTGSTSNS